MPDTRSAFVGEKIWYTSAKRGSNAPIAWIAQLVEHFPEEEGVPGSSPGPSTTTTKNRPSGRLFVIRL